jgi:hypothetical protein
MSAIGRVANICPLYSSHMSHVYVIVIYHYLTNML